MNDKTKRKRSRKKTTSASWRINQEASIQEKSLKLIKAEEYVDAERLLHQEYERRYPENFGYGNLVSLARLNMKLDRSSRAELFLFQAIDKDDKNPEAPEFLVQIYLSAKQFHAAIEIIHLLLKIDPTSSQYRYWQILSLCGVPQRSSEIIPAWNSFFADFPDASTDTQLHNAVVYGLCGAGRYLEAEDHVKRFKLEEIYDSGTGQCLPVLYQGLGQIDKAIERLNAMAAKDPENVAWVWNRGLMKLSAGDLIGGWSDYRARWDWKDFPSPKRTLNLPEWNGESLQDASILVWAEQGLGDQFMFGVGINALLKKAPKHVRIEVLTKAMPTFERWYPECEIAEWANVADQDELLQKQFDYQISMGDLVGCFFTSQDAILNLPRRYLRLPVSDRPQSVTEFGQQFPVIIGIAWRSHAIDSVRHTSYANVKFIKYIIDHLPKDIGFAVLQYAITEEEKQLLTECDNVLIPEEDLFNDILALGQYCSSCDLVVTPAIMVWQLAGVYKVPVITWGVKNVWTKLGMDISPWFPNIDHIDADAYYDRRRLADVIVSKVSVATKGLVTEKL